MAPNTVCRLLLGCREVDIGLGLVGCGEFSLGGWVWVF